MKNERLTEKYDICYKHKDITKKELDKMYEAVDSDRNRLAQTFWKLGKIEDLEEKFGIGFIILGKAMTEGLWFKNERGEVIHARANCLGLKSLLVCEEVVDGENYMTEYLEHKDYGKTWALTKEELE